MCRRCANVFPWCIGDVVILSPPLVCRWCAAAGATHHEQPHRQDSWPRLCQRRQHPLLVKIPPPCRAARSRSIHAWYSPYMLGTTVHAWYSPLFSSFPISLSLFLSFALPSFLVTSPPPLPSLPVFIARFASSGHDWSLPRRLPLLPQHRVCKPPLLVCCLAYPSRTTSPSRVTPHPPSSTTHTSHTSHTPHTRTPRLHIRVRSLFPARGSSRPPAHRPPAPPACLPRPATRARTTP